MRSSLKRGEQHKEKLLLVGECKLNVENRTKENTSNGNIFFATSA